MGSFLSTLLLKFSFDIRIVLRVDCIGSCIFHHEFNAVRGQDSLVLEALSAFNQEQPSATAILFHIVTLYVPFAGGIPLGRNKYFFKLSTSAKEIMDSILADRRNNIGVVEDHKRKKSMIEMLSTFDFYILCLFRHLAADKLMVKKEKPKPKFLSEKPPLKYATFSIVKRGI